MFTLDDDNKLLREVGLSTLFLTSLFIAIFAASGAVGEEIENKTIMTVLTKPVQRPIFILAKFLGVAAAVLLAHYICTIALLMAIRHGVMVAVWESHDWTVIAAAGAGITLTLILTGFFNYAYDWKFTSTAVVLAGLFATAGMVFLLFIDRNWKLDIYGSVLLLLAATIIVALAVALSARFNIVVTLSACIGLFLAGLISDYVFGRFADTHLWAKVCYFVVPNLQMFWISDAIYEGSTLPIRYILISTLYAACYTTAILALTVAVFQRRQVG
jgi:ABC-type Na+ efflux pump permease subunit